MAKFNFEKDLEVMKKYKKGIVKYPVISECPVCHGDLVVTKLECNNCGTELSGSFTLSKFNYLDTDKLYFIEVFVKNRGNIKMIEKEMGLSYPTIKKLLDDVIEQLGYSAKEEDEPKEEYNGPSRKEILQKIDQGEINVEEAAKLLAKIK